MARESVPLKGKKKQDTAGVLPPLISLKCHCCEGYFKEPVTLPCMHSFCRVCLEKYNAQRISKELGERRLERGESEDTEVSNLNNSFSKPGEGKAEEKIPEDYVINVQCPTCIETLKLAPPIEPQVPFENSRLARIVGLVHDSNVVCQNCSEATSEQKCTTCNAWLCVECMELTHSAPIFRTHSKVPLTHSEMMTLPKCDTHPMNDLEFFSTEEEVGVCQVCLLKGDFVGKPYCLVSDVRKARQHEIERGVKVVTDEKERLLAGRQKMELVLDQLKKKLEQQTDAVKANFSLIREALNKREQETLDGLQTLKDAKATVLETQIAQTEHIVGVIDDGVRNVKLVLNHSNDLELVYLTIVLQEFISEMSKIDAPKFKSVDHALEYYHSAAVDADLPVLLSDKVANLVSAYAPVPRPSFVEDTASTGKTGAGEGSSQGGKGVRTAKAPGSSPMKLKVEKPELTKQQKVLLKDVGAEDKGEEYGCVVQ